MFFSFSENVLLLRLTEHPEQFSVNYLKIIHKEHPEVVENLLAEIAGAKPGDEILKPFENIFGAEKTIKKAEGILHFLKEPVEEEKAEPAPEKQLSVSDLDRAADLIFLGFTTLQAKFLVILGNNKERINNYNYDPVEILEQQQGTAIDLAVETNRIAIQKNLTSIRRKYHDLSFKGKQSVARVLNLDTKTFEKLINYNASTLRAGGVGNVANDEPKPQERRPYRSSAPVPLFDRHEFGDPLGRANLTTPDAPEPGEGPKRTDPAKEVLDGAKDKFETKPARTDDMARLNATKSAARTVMQRYGIMGINRISSVLNRINTSTADLAAALREDAFWETDKFKLKENHIKFFDEIITELEQVDKNIASEFRAGLVGKPLRKICFVCYCNARRSKIAENFAQKYIKNKYGDKAGEFKITSAGVDIEDYETERELTLDIVKNVDIIFITPDAYEDATLWFADDVLTEKFKVTDLSDSILQKSEEIKPLDDIMNYIDYREKLQNTFSANEKK